MTESQQRKSQLRRELRLRRNSLRATEQLAAAQLLAQVVTQLPAWSSAQRIALYLAADGEIDTTALQLLARSLHKKLYLPCINEDNSLRFSHWQDEATLVSNRYQIPEPPADAARCPASDLDIIFLPMVGWDRSGRRLGMGGGYYDRTLADVTGPLLVGLAHANQEVTALPVESWDVVLDYVATDAGLCGAPRENGAIQS